MKGTHVLTATNPRPLGTGPHGKHVELSRKQKCAPKPSSRTLLPLPALFNSDQSATAKPTCFGGHPILSPQDKSECNFLSINWSTVCYTTLKAFSLWPDTLNLNSSKKNALQLPIDIKFSTTRDPLTNALCPWDWNSKFKVMSTVNRTMCCHLLDLGCSAVAIYWSLNVTSWRSTLIMRSSSW